MENKISLATRTTSGAFKFVYGTAFATYPVTSYVIVTVTNTAGGEGQLNIGKGDSSSTEESLGIGSSDRCYITSIFPTEDNTYIYTF